MSITEITNKLDFNFKQLYSLKKENIELYNEFFTLLNSEEKDILDSIRLIYIAYYLNDPIPYKEFEKIIDNFALVEIRYIFNTVFSIKRNSNFRDNFRKKLKRKSSMSVPEFKLEDVEDYYTYYVLILEISEDLFWNYSFSFLMSVSENKSAYDSFISKVKEKTLEERRK